MRTKLETFTADRKPDSRPLFAGLTEDGVRARAVAYRLHGEGMLYPQADARGFTMVDFLIGLSVFMIGVALFGGFAR